MLKFIKKHQKLLITLSFAYIYLFVVLIVPSGYGLNTPGELSKIDNHIYDIDGVEFINDFNTVSVYSWHEVTVFQKWLVTKVDEFDLYEQTPLDDTLSISDVNKRGKISKEASHQLAIITAYENAANKDDSIEIDYDFKGLTVYTNFNKFVDIGTLIVGVDDVNLLTDPTVTYQDLMLATLTPIGDNNYRRKNQMTLTLADGSTKEVNYSEGSNEFMTFYPKFEITKTVPYYNEKADQRNVGGPSGGMMQALAIYTALLEIDLSSLKIAGTGTIDLFNNFRVGEIGGLVQKYYTTRDFKANVFFIPSSQYDELQRLDNNENLKVLPVNNFNDVIREIDLLLGGLNNA